MGDYYPTELLSPSVPVEKFHFNGSEETIKFTSGINVILSLSSDGTTRDRDSARVTTRNLIEFKSDVRTIFGRSLAVYNDLIACRITVENSGEHVRIINKVTKNRDILKNLPESLVDMQFAPHAPLLATVDRKSCLSIYSVCQETAATVRSFSLSDWPEDQDKDVGWNTRISWCPYAPENPSDPDDFLHVIAVYKKNRVLIVNLTILEEKFGSEVQEMTFAEAQTIDEAIVSIVVEDDVSVVCISPDSTAVAVASKTGMVSFYVLNGNEAKFAHNWNPRFTSVTDLFFLDDISRENLSGEPERFWRHCVVVGESGRHLAIFECEQWKCLGTLRFDCAVEYSKFTVFIDPRIRYLHLLDTDGANIFCVELQQGTSAPRFASVSQITFYNQVVSIFPYDVEDKKGDDTLEDSYNDSNSDITAKIISLTSRKLAQLDIQLEKSELIALHEPDTQFQSEEPIKLELPSAENPVLFSNVQSVSYSPNENMDNQMSKIFLKLEEINMRLRDVESDNNNRISNEHIVRLLNRLEQESSSKDYLLANVTELMETNKAEIMSMVRNALNENSLAVEGSIQVNQKQSCDAISQRVSDRVRESLLTAVVPAIDRICGQLFKQLNESFRAGLEQYMAQIRALHTATLAAVASATPVPPGSVSADRQQLTLLIQSGQAAVAVETVLNQGDQAALEFVCKHLDPDQFFANANLSQPVLISLLQQLSIHLNTETEMKFRYFSLILDKLKLNDPETSRILSTVLKSLSSGLSDIQQHSNDHVLKVQARLLNQVIRSSMKN